MAPILILAIYTYLHLYLLKLWRGIGALPAYVHVGGSIESVPLDDAVHPPCDSHLLRHAR
ncbi:MAG: hypothetical protein ACU0B1_02735 [Thermohalobaculum sp.]